MTVKLILYFAAAVLLFSAMQFLLSHFAKNQGNTEAASLTASASGLAGAAFFLTLSCRTMLQSGNEIAIVVLNLALVLTGCASSAVLVTRNVKMHTTTGHSPAGRFAVILVIMGAYAAISTLTILSFAHSESMTALLEAGLFLVTRLAFLFPLAVAALAFIWPPSQKKT